MAASIASLAAILKDFYLGPSSQSTSLVTPL
jgi:hypothetical protein